MSPITDSQKTAYEAEDSLEQMELIHTSDGYQGQDDEHQMRPHVVIFSKPNPEEMSGKILIFSPKFICVQWNGGGSNIPPEGRVITNSLENAVEFIRLAFVEKTDHEELGHLLAQ